MPIQSLPFFSRIFYSDQKAVSFIPHEIDNNLSGPVYRNGKFYFPSYPTGWFLKRIFFRHLIHEGPVNFIFCLNELVAGMTSDELLQFVIRFEREANKEIKKLISAKGHTTAIVYTFIYNARFSKIEETISYFPQWMQLAYSRVDEVAKLENVEERNDNSPNQHQIETEILKRKISDLETSIMDKAKLVNQLEKENDSLKSEITFLCSLKWTGEVNDISELVDAMLLTENLQRKKKADAFDIFNRILNLGSNSSSMSSSVTDIRKEKRDPNYKGKFLMDLEKNHIQNIKKAGEKLDS